MKQKFQRVLAIALFLSALLVVWEVVPKLVLANSNLFPAPFDVLNAFVEMILNGELLADTSASAGRLFIGFLLGALFGIIAGIFTAKNFIFDSSAGQFLHFLRFIPPLALVPLAIIWLGIGEFSKIGLIFWASFFPVWVNTFIGVKNVQKKHIWAAKNLGAKQLKLIKEVILPSSAPFIVAGSRIGLGIGFGVLVAAEMAGAFSGLGYRIAISHQVFRVDKMIADIILLGAIGLISDRILVLFAKKLVPWHGRI